MATKMTQKIALNYVLDNCKMPTDVADKIKAMAVALEKKSAKGGERKPTATQKANEIYKGIILDNMEVGRAYTVGELTKEIPFGDDVEMSSQKVSALVKQLKDAGKVIRTEEKRKAYFTLAE